MKRIEYIDAMRGFNMILIVMLHFITISYGGVSGFSWSYFFTTFQLPLFFFISGFLMYKENRIWSVNTTFDYLTNKAKALLIPSFVFFSLYIYISKADLWVEFCIDSKSGYWFTFTLFEYYVIYMIVMFLFAKCSLLNGGGKIALIVISLLLIWSNHPKVYQIVMPNIIGVGKLRYFIFFFAGTLAKEYYSKFQMLLDNQYFMGTIIVALLFVELFGLGDISESVRFVLDGFMGLTIMFSFFRKYENFHDTTIGRGLQYIGTRTLDIYLLHYFFLPHNLQVFGKFFSDFNNPTIELFVSSFLTLIVVAICLITSSIIRLSPMLAHWVLGVKYTK